MSNTVNYGIDLGTTNSCIGSWQDAAVRIFQNNDQMNVTPSAVHIHKTGRMIVGKRAQGALLTDPANVAVEFKRWMGQKDRQAFAAAGKQLSAVELSAEILKSLREDVKRQTGSEIDAAVVTVPAAFGALQCEATARAAELAGLREAPLLQEPIAAAIAYGCGTASTNQRWLVFDLGGGTLDIAVVSTRDGRLNVVEHRGHNLKGGKDIDRLIVERVLLPALDDAYALLDLEAKGARKRIMPQLRVKAEEAKIDLSRDTQVVISLFGLGEDDAGREIELEIPFSRAQLDALTAPLVGACCDLAEEALAAARISGADIDRILLVGGPTQAPQLRAMVSSRLGAPVDFSIDPMTVVCRGAAIYASTLERTKAPQKVSSGAAIKLKLAFEPVSAELNPIVAGRVIEGQQAIEIKIDAEGGLWTSGWLKLNKGLFETPLALKEGAVNTFWVYARNATGGILETDKPEFVIRHGLVPSAPPLPHTLSVEIVKGSDGAPALDPVFSKGTALPTSKTVSYRASHQLIPGNAESDLAIKIWEGEFPDDPDANEWVGNALLSHDGVNRIIPEGAEIEVTIQIDVSRRMTIEAFVPHLNQHFTTEVYLAQREEQDFSNLAAKVVSESRDYKRRLEALEISLSSRGDESSGTELAELRKEVDRLRDELARNAKSSGPIDPDDARRSVEDSKDVRGRIGRLERRARQSGSSNSEHEVNSSLTRAEQVVNQFGTSLDKQQFSALRKEVDHAATSGNEGSLKRLREEIDTVHWRILFQQDWFWRDIFESLRQPGVVFLNSDESARLILKGDAAVKSGKGEALKEAVRGLWALQPKDDAQITRERAVRSGLRKS
jgi:molecular chaperone DnaK